MILYPTETIYALGVNALDEDEVRRLEEFKGRGAGKSLSWLVRDIDDIAYYAYLNSTSKKLINSLLPGPLTLVLSAKDKVPPHRRLPNGEVSFRISNDPIAQIIIQEFMAKHSAPLTCTSANVSGEDPANAPEEIIKQFIDHQKDTSAMTEIYDDGVRSNTNSTVVKITENNRIEVLREGAITQEIIFSLL